MLIKTTIMEPQLTIVISVAEAEILSGLLQNTQRKLLEEEPSAERTLRYELFEATRKFANRYAKMGQQAEVAK